MELGFGGRAGERGRSSVVHRARGAGKSTLRASDQQLEKSKYPWLCSGRLWSEEMEGKDPK